MNKEIDITNIVLHTSRLTLRPWCQADLDDFFEYAKVDGVGQCAGWLPHQSKEDTQNILDSFISSKKTFALVYEGKTIGSLGIEKYKEEDFPEFKDLQCREIGYVLSKDYWGKGLMSEAVKEVIRYLFEEVELDCILCGYFKDNARSASVQRKCGFKYLKDGTYTTYYGVIHDDVHNILTKEDWYAFQKSANR